MKSALFVSTLCLMGLATAPPAWADPFAFNNGNVTDGMAAASRPDTNGFEIETGDDFLLGSHTRITGASFVGLLPAEIPEFPVFNAKFEPPKKIDDRCGDRHVPGYRHRHDSDDKSGQ